MESHCAYCGTPLVFPGRCSQCGRTVGEAVAARQGEGDGPHDGPQLAGWIRVVLIVVCLGLVLLAYKTGDERRNGAAADPSDVGVRIHQRK